MLEVLLVSLVFGSVFALFAFSFCFSYRLEKYINFSHVAIFLLSVYLGFVFCSILEFGVFVSLLLIIAISQLVGVGFYMPTFLLKNNYQKLLYSITVVGVVQGVLSLIFKESKELPKATEGLMIGNTIINSTSLMSFVVLVIVLTLSYIIIKRTRFGKAVRAILDDETAARIIGINLNFVKLLVALFASSLAGISGLLFSLNFGEATLSLLPGFKAMAIAVIGSFGILLTTAVSFIVILIESFVKIYLPYSEHYSKFIIFVILLLLLLFRIPKRGRL